MRQLCAGLFVLFFLTAPGWTQNRLDLVALKGDTLVFERILDERLKLGFSNPFAITDNPQAAYLQGYGVVVSFHLNINRYSIRTPFGEVQAPQEGKYSREKREEQLSRVRDIAIQCLADYSRAIKQLSAHDRISVSAHIEDRNELDPVRRRTIMIVTATRDDVDLLAMRKISEQDFRKRVTILEY
jgi:hypothetical protein